MQLVDGSWLSLVFSAFLTAVRPSWLSILGDIDTTSHETNRVPSRKGPFRLRSSILLSKSVVSLMKDGNLRANGANDIQ